ncbi:hypothetical protein Pan189_14570 [Stratiformator vulcanicus]|uniref:Uncharacterized protein n=2 Tax=Stratiformator vulcanicus TaxID=2527980 RepID=A0A517QZM6_9PLAN|nr:hypothetical protein Pan189_14570 [Stratiformator vulcanicus]
MGFDLYYVHLIEFNVRSLLITCLITLLSTSTVATGAEVTATYFSGLRDRGLFSLAESVALNRLAADDLSNDERAALSLELSKTFAQHAIHTLDTEQIDLYQRAESVIEKFLAVQPRHPRALELRLQRAMIDLERGRSLRWTAELTRSDSAALSAKGFLKKAATELQTLSDQIHKAFRRRTRGIASSDDRVDPAELYQWEEQARLGAAQAMIAAARLNPRGDSNSNRALQEADRLLEKLARGVERNPITRSAKIWRAEVARLSGDGQAARRRLADIEPTSLTPQDRDAMAAVSVRILLDEDKPDAAAELLVNYRKERGSLSGELQLLKVQTLVELERAARAINVPELAVDVQRQIDLAVERAKVEVGGVWAYRCRLAADAVGNERQFGPEIAAQIERAERLAATGKTSEAADAYFSSAEAMVESGDSSAAAKYAFRAGSLASSENNYQSAKKFFLAAAKFDRNDPLSAQAHLMAAWCAGRSSNSQKAIAEYRRLLEEHREIYSSAATNAEATLMLARLEESRRQYSRALPLYRDTLTIAEKADVARAGIARCLDRLLAFLAEESAQADDPKIREVRQQQLQEWSNTASSEFADLAAGLPDVETRWSPHDAEFAVVAAQRLSKLPTNQTDLALNLAERALRSSEFQRPNDREFWQKIGEAADGLRSAIRVSAGDFSGGLADDSELRRMTVTARISLLQDLRLRLSELSVGPRTQCGRLMLKIVESVEGNGSRLKPAERWLLAKAKAEADIAVGELDRAEQTVEQLTQMAGSDAGRMREAAQIAERLGERGAERTLDLWQRITARLPAGSDEWLAARINSVEALITLGRLDEARKLIRVTRLLAPNAGDAELRNRLNELDAATNSDSARPNSR